MRIAVDYQSAAGRKTGIGNVTTNLFAALAREKHDLEFLFYSSGRDDLNTPRRIWWESVQVPLKTMRDRPDLVYVPGFAPAIASTARQVVLVHDLIGLAFASNQTGAARFYWSRWLPFTLRRAHRLVANSETTRRDMERFLHVSSSRIRVIPFAVDNCFRKLTSGDTMRALLDRLGLGTRPFMIAVGTLEPRKNHKRLIDAYGLLMSAGDPGFDLAIVGKDAGMQAELFEQIKGKRLEDRIKLLGFVTNEDLVGLYNASLGFALPSLYEGFGLPALEAMSCGKSGVVSDRSSLPEVVGDAAILVDPEDPAAIAEGLKTFASDAPLRRRLEVSAVLRAKGHTSSAMARAMVEVFHEAAA